MSALPAFCVAFLLVCAAIMGRWLWQDITTEPDRAERGFLWYLLAYLVVGVGGSMVMVLWGLVR